MSHPVRRPAGPPGLPPGAGNQACRLTTLPPGSASRRQGSGAWGLALDEHNQRLWADPSVFIAFSRRVGCHDLSIGIHIGDLRKQSDPIRACRGRQTYGW